MDNTFEYKSVRVSRNRKKKEKALNAYGAQGWEIISITDLLQGFVTVNMKRVKSAGSQPVQTGLFSRLFGQ